jgi:hypothetical protein
MSDSCLPWLAEKQIILIFVKYKTKAQPNILYLKVSEISLIIVTSENPKLIM